jgi:hypothetical protein
MASSGLNNAGYYLDRRGVAPFVGMKIVSFMKNFS